MLRIEPFLSTITLYAEQWTQFVIKEWTQAKKVITDPWQLHLWLKPRDESSLDIPTNMAIDTQSVKNGSVSRNAEAFAIYAFPKISQTKVGLCH